MRENSNSDISAYLNIVIDYYNKSALLYNLGESSFYEEALEKQTVIASTTSDVKEKEVLEEYKKGYARCKNVTTLPELNNALFNPSLTAKMKEVFDKKLAEEIEKSSRTYSGAKKAGRMHGKGTMNYADGSIYTGEWVNDKREGIEKLTWMSGKGEYYGQWKNDLKNGN